MPDEQKPDWYQGMSAQSRTVMQFGFAGLVAVMFFWQSRDFAAEARNNREMYREEQHALRAEIRASTTAADARSETTEKRMLILTTQVVDLASEMRRTADALQRAGLRLEKAAEKVGQEQGVIAPAPRAKPDEGWPTLIQRFKGLP